MTVLDDLSRPRRKDLVSAATALYKSGAEPNPVGVEGVPSRAELRRAARALGHRGSKSARQNPDRAARQQQAMAKKVAQAVLLDDALLAAKDRVEHPVRSRLRRS